jgi:outer membrane lipoprotein SlyB
VASLTEDTPADKLFRFVLGAVGGAGSGWLYAARFGGADGDVVRTIVGFAVIGGLMAAVFGNAFIERALRSRWW